VSTAIATPTAPASRRFDHARSSLGNVIRSEWTKIWSVRSTFWTLLTLIVTTIGFSVLFAWGASTHLDQMSPSDRAHLDVTFNSMSGLMLGQLAIAVLGVMVVTTEFSTGGIKSTLTAVPNRGRVLLAKAIVFAIVATVVGMITVFGAFYAAMPFWAHQHLAAHLSDPSVLRAVIGAGLYVLASGLFGFAFGALIRHTAGAITIVVALLFVVPLILNALPNTAWGRWIYEHFTSNAGSMIATTVPQVKGLAPWTGYITFTIWWVVPLIIGAYLMRRRDA
jgi:ABC-type transport system involved in multi-copper enzyme maturation permease subunit